MIFLVAFISFLLGLFVNLVFFPYLLAYIVKRGWKYAAKLNSSSVFRWTVSLIASFAVGALIIQAQRERAVKESQQVVDSLRWELRMLQQKR